MLVLLFLPLILGGFGGIGAGFISPGCQVEASVTVIGGGGQASITASQLTSSVTLVVT